MKASREAPTALCELPSAPPSVRRAADGVMTASPTVTTPIEAPEVVRPHVLQQFTAVPNARVLIVDDNPAIHADFRKVLAANASDNLQLDAAEAALFGDAKSSVLQKHFELDSAFQGQEALEKVRDSVEEERPFAMAFVDVRMPPGWDGIETIARIWELYPELQVVICTAYSDYSWEEIIPKLGSPDNFVILKKPFDSVEVLQLAHALTRKWELNRQAKLKLGELSRMVAERTRELENANEQVRREFQERVQLERQFRQAQKMEAIGQLAAGIAHDFNNILTVIQGYASMLQLRLGEEGPHAKALSSILASSERATNLVRQLLMFSRKRVMQFSNVDVNEVIHSVSGMLRQLVGEHITLETQCAPNLPAIYADKNMIEQIMVNLTVNARDAIAKEGNIALRSARVIVSAATQQQNPDARPGCFICLSVTDTGCGISSDILPHLFEPFFTTKAVGKGTGLGLATVYGIVKQHQGWIDVESRVGLGTAFHIYLPLADKDCAQASSENLPRRRTASGSETILVAEDEPALREMVSDTLTMCGYRVVLAQSGPAALETWKHEQGRIDLLLTDMVMPGGMMGTDLAEELKRLNPALKVIFSTGYSPGMNAEQATLQEGNNFLPKPYSPQKLAEIVRKCLDS